jgi:hypothetical protein
MIYRTILKTECLIFLKSNYFYLLDSKGLQRYEYENFHRLYSINQTTDLMPLYSDSFVMGNIFCEQLKGVDLSGCYERLMIESFDDPAFIGKEFIKNDIISDNFTSMCLLTRKWFSLPFKDFWELYNCDMTWNLNESRICLINDMTITFVPLSKHIGKYTFISHIWELPNEPDPLNQIKLSAFKRYNQFWLDFLSLPQKHIHENYDDYKIVFKQELNNMYNIQSNGLSVKIIAPWAVDDYNHRAWCIAEQSLMGETKMIDLLRRYIKQS